VILYFGLLQLGVPILLADIRRLAIDGTIPCTNCSNEVPPDLRRALEKTRWFVVFKGTHFVVPPVKDLAQMARKIAHQLAMKGPLLIRPANVGGLVMRFVRELSLPNAFAAMIRKLLEIYGIAAAYFGPQAERCYCPDLLIMAGVIFFLKLHYGLDTPK
jgi:hypothetical protein